MRDGAPPTAPAPEGPPPAVEPRPRSPSTTAPAPTRGLLLPGALLAVANGALAAIAGAVVAGRLALAAGAGTAGTDGAGGAALVGAWTGALALVGTLATALAAAPAAHRAPRTATAAVLGVNAALLLLLVLDVRTYVLLGVHLHSPVSLDALSNAGAARELALGPATLAAIAAAGAALLASEWALLRAAAALARRSPGPGWGLAGGGVVAAVAVLATVSSRSADAATPLLDALPAWELLAQGAPWQAHAGAVRWPGDAAVTPGPAPARSPDAARQPDVLFVVAESLRWDAPADAPMPELRMLARERQCITPVRHHSGGHTTEYGVFTLLYGLESHRFGPFGRDGLRSLPLSLLRRAGYRLVGASASALRSWNDAAFVVDQLDAYEELVTDGSWEGDEAVARAAERWAALPREQPLFAFVFLNATHHNYLYPPAFERHVPVIEPGYDHFLGDDALASRQAEIRNRYLNAAGYADTVIRRVVDAFGARGAPIVVVTGDHGEELWEHGLLGHGAPRFVEERIRVPLLLCIPGVDGAEVPVERSSHVDVWPTILDALAARGALGPAGAPPPAAWSDGRSLLTRSPPPPHVIGGTTFPWGNPTGCVVDGDRKVWLRVGRAPGPVLQATRVTDLDDHPLQGVDPRPSVARALERMGRFVELRWEE